MDGELSRSLGPYVNQAAIREQEGDYEAPVELNRQALRLNPNIVIIYEDLGAYLLALGRLDEARKMCEEALSRKLDDDILHENLYSLAFLAGDAKSMGSQAAWFEGKPGLQHEILALEADTEAYGGHLARARELTRQAAEGAVRAGNPEAAAAWRLDAALREAAFGNAAQARRDTQAALKLAPDSRDIEVQAALADAWAGDEGGVPKLESEIKKRFPLNTIVNSYWLPTVEARVKLAEDNPAVALDRLQTVSSPLELGWANLPSPGGMPLYPVYTRGDAFLAAGQGSAAAGEFQKILGHPGIVINCPTGALAHLGLARAYALEAGLSRHGENGGPFTSLRASSKPPLQPDALAKARAAYQDFLALWKDAEPDIPILKQAEAEYARLQRVLHGPAATQGDESSTWLSPPRRRGPFCSHSNPPQSRLVKDWIPAFAGMTTVGDFRQSLSKGPKTGPALRAFVALMNSERARRPASERPRYTADMDTRKIKHVGRKQKAFPEGSFAKLKAAVKSARTKAQLQQAQCLWLRVAHGLSALEVAAAIGWSESNVRRFQARYLREGEAALAGPGRGGRRNQILSLCQEEICCAACGASTGPPARSTRRPSGRLMKKPPATACRPPPSPGCWRATAGARSPASRSPSRSARPESTSRG